jgi:hypothetical protein
MSNESMLVRQHQMYRPVRPALDAAMTTDSAQHRYAPIIPSIDPYCERLFHE